MEHKITYGPVDKSSVGFLKLIHKTVLPVEYSERIYETIKDGKAAKGELAYYNDDTPVGEMCYRIEHDTECKLYIMTISVLPRYRRLHIASSLIDRAIAASPECTEIYLHVLEGNEDAIAFYTKLGFTQSELVEGYYKGLGGKNAYIFSRPIDKQ